MILSPLGAQHFVSATYLGNTAPSAFIILTNKATYNVDAYKITYNTTDVDGSATIASGILAVPQGMSCDSLPAVAYCHGTVLRREDVPSRDNAESVVPKVAASVGAIAVAPDYLGLGDNPGLHPYLHAETQATATIDLLRAAREYLRDSLNVYFNTQTFVTGYSQGGHAAMATVKYIQDNSLSVEFDIIGAGPASGPYNLSGSQAEVLVSNAPYSNPGYICYLLFGMNRVYGNIYQSYSDILKAPYDTLIPPYFDGTFDMAAVNALLPDTLSGFLQDSVLTNFKNDSVGRTHPIWQALVAQDNFDWNPSFPMEIYYCTLDEQVNFQNALDAEAAMLANGASVTAVDRGALTHGGCVVPTLQRALNYFLSLSSPCTIGLEEQLFAQKIQLYPNPASDYFSIEGLENRFDLSVFNSLGQSLHHSTLVDGEPVDIRTWLPGVYMLEISQNGQRAYRRLVIR